MSDYPHIMRAEVPAWLRVTVRRAARDAAKELGIHPPPRLIWRRGVGRYLAWVEDTEWTRNEINLNVSRLEKYSPPQVRSLVYHETRHIWQYQTMRFSFDKKQNEQDANEFAFISTGVLAPTLQSWEY